MKEKQQFELLAELRSMGHSSINALAKHLHRQYRNVLMMSKLWSGWDCRGVLGTVYIIDKHLISVILQTWHA